MTPPPAPVMEATTSTEMGLRPRSQATEAPMAENTPRPRASKYLKNFSWLMRRRGNRAVTMTLRRITSG